VGRVTGLLHTHPLLVRQNPTNPTENSEPAARCHNWPGETDSPEFRRWLVDMIDTGAAGRQTSYPNVG
jgi:hypothetical protein